ncbi:GNAT family N-acetyltransferase [Alkalihalophilus pseudofirmus]|uniref:GNAT family N-acetyltransferase n=1 Tax=Alkalihalophilus pseudofirmus TaxID=79885 RepID=A0AAJ2KXJ6_ALKPS|nr:GNAT family N-acetyltransferase [Alkalihalophilus pseudofirmus]MDV2885001.1 GNAT family N-acetyltransferase [Alkalihalophilus pseudofirmus]
MSINIKEYEEKNKEQIINLILPIQQDEYAIPITEADQPDLLDIYSYYIKEGGNFWTATISNEVVGTISFLKVEDGVLALRKMFVKKEYRGSRYNIAARLLEYALEWAKGNEFDVIYLGTTNEFKAAHRFYEKNHFQEVTKSDLPSSFPIVHVDRKFYRRKLN